MEEALALEILARYTPELTPEARAALLTEHTLTRIVAGQPVALQDPYAAAVAHLMNPATLKARTEGSVSETYIDPEKVAAYLQGESARLRESWPAADSAAPQPVNLDLNIGGW